MNIFNLPDLGEGLQDGEIREWLVKEGDEVTVDQPLVAIETAKALVEVPSPFTGKVTKLYGQAGDVINTGAPLVGYVADGETEQPKEKRKDAGTVVGALEIGKTVLEESAVGLRPKKTTVVSGQIKATPGVRALAQRLDVDLSQIQGSGPDGAISATDVRFYQQSKPAAGATRKPSADKGEPLHGVRRSMAIAMAQSHAEVVPVTIMDDATISWDKKVDVTLRLIRAVQHACQAEPALNAHFYGANLSRELKQNINLGIAVDTEKGLYVPVVHNIAKQSDKQIRKTIESFKSKAEKQSFSPDDLKDGTIILSNFGSIAGRYASPIVLPPMVAVIGIGKKRNNELPISVTFDHRAVTGGEAARFLAAMIKSLES